MAKKRADGRYQKKILVDGKQVFFYGKSQKEINQKIKEFYEKRETGELFETVADKWWEEIYPDITPNTRKGYKAAYNRLLSFFQDKTIKSITAQDIMSFVNYVIDMYDIKGKKTIENHLIVIRGIFRFGCIKGYIATSPAEYIRPPKNLKKEARRFPTDDEIAMVKVSYDKTFGLFYYMILYTGCRPEELLALRWRDVDFKNKKIHIDKALTYDDEHSYRPMIKETKTSAGVRDVPILNKLYPVLLANKNSSAMLVFPNSKGDYLHNKQCWNLEKQYQKETGLKELTPYQLRHAFATMCYEAGLEDKDFQTFMGHASIQMSKEIYTHIRKQKTEQAIELLNRVDF